MVGMLDIRLDQWFKIQPARAPCSQAIQDLALPVDLIVSLTNIAPRCLTSPILGKIVSILYVQKPGYLRSGLAVRIRPAANVSNS